MASSFFRRTPRLVYRFPSTGGSPTQVTTPDISAAENSHRWPVFLSDGHHFLYLAANFSGEYEKNAVYAGSLDCSQKVRVVAASSNVAYVDPGYLLYVRDNALVAQHFDAKKLTLIGDPHTIAGASHAQHDARHYPHLVRPVPRLAVDVVSENDRILLPCSLAYVTSRV